MGLTKAQKILWELRLICFLKLKETGRRSLKALQNPNLYTRYTSVSASKRAAQPFTARPKPDTPALTPKPLNP